MILSAIVTAPAPAKNVHSLAFLSLKTPGGYGKRECGKYIKAYARRPLLY